MNLTFLVKVLRDIYIYICIYIYKLSPKWKKFHEQKVFFFRFYILCENFSKIGPIIKKIPKFQSDPLNIVSTFYSEFCILILGFRKSMEIP